MASRRVSLNSSNGVAELVLDAPPRNEMSLAFFDDLIRLVDGPLGRLDARGMIVHGRGRHFSSGADIEELTAWIRDNPEDAVLRRLGDAVRCFEAIAALPFPVVAAISGCCLGVALELALACDYRICSRRAVLALPEAQFGLMPGAGGTVRLTRLVGGPLAADIVLSGRTIGASEAHPIGLVDLAPRDEDVVDTARSLIDRARGRKDLFARDIS